MGTQHPLSRKGRSPLFSANVYCGQTAAWIKMPLGMEVGLGPGHIVLDGDPASPPRKGGTVPSPIFGPRLLWPNGWMNLDTMVGLGPGNIVLHADPAPTPRGTALPQISAHVCCDQTAGCIKMPLGTKVGLVPGCIITWGPGSRSQKDHRPPSYFWPMSIVTKQSPISATAEHLSF